MKTNYLFYTVILLVISFENIMSQNISWQHISKIDSNNVNGMTITPSGIIYVATHYGVHRSTDNGISWKKVRLGSIYDGLPKELTSNSKNHVFLLVGGYGVERSTDNGESWQSINTGFQWHYADAIVVGNGDTLFMSGIGGVYKSTNNGDSWDTVGLHNNNHRSLLITKTGTVYVGTADDIRIYRSTNAGNSWTSVSTGITVSQITSLCEGNENEIFSGGYNSVFHTTDNGDSWAGVQIDFPGAGENYGIVRSRNGRLYTSVGNVGILMSTNNGANWQLMNEGLNTVFVRKLCLSSDGYLYVGTYNQGIYRSTIATSVKNINDETPKSYLLEQNYPNPFNPSTTISFNLPKTTLTTLKVYNLVGREVTTLVSEELSAGNHSYAWNATGLSSGIYFYRLQTGSFFEIKKLILVK